MLTVIIVIVVQPRLCLKHVIVVVCHDGRWGDARHARRLQLRGGQFGICTVSACCILCEVCSS